MGKGESTRLAVLDEAVALASRVGLGGLTIGSLADATGLSKSGLFAHFKSKESLQLQVLARATERFTDVVVRPALAAPRGEPRMRTLFERWLVWNREALPGGCIFVTAATELDDRPGPVRDKLVADQRDWMDLIRQVFGTGIAEGHFRRDADPEQFAQDLHGLLLGCHWASRLLSDPQAETRARRSFEALIDAVRVPDRQATR